MVVGVALWSVVGCRPLAWSAGARLPADTPEHDPSEGAPAEHDPSEQQPADRKPSDVWSAEEEPPEVPARPPRARGSEVDAADGLVPAGTTVFDNVPAVANLNPALLDALRTAAKDAAAGGVEFVVNSGWRTPAYQQRLLDEAIAKYGSLAEASRWVATPETSPHVSGDAVDLGPPEATAWLSEHGAAYGLCQVYRNEPWHYELRPEAIGNGCPPMYPDPSHDPRMAR